ncbi:HindIII family type II restriction endonuclease [Leptospira borgpetersenii]|uniref:HindIII family type II restriction endonuclease n=1 Tax=Leptospira borgpetersenii TaxID=174 RepID=UPI003905C808
MAVLIRSSSIATTEDCKKILNDIYKSIYLFNPSKYSVQYWVNINRTMLNYDDSIAAHWANEKLVTIEGIAVSKKMAIEFVSSERIRVFKMTKDESVNAPVNTH